MCTGIHVPLVLLVLVPAVQLSISRYHTAHSYVRIALCKMYTNKTTVVHIARICTCDSMIAKFDSKRRFFLNLLSDRQQPQKLYVSTSIPGTYPPLLTSSIFVHSFSSNSFSSMLPIRRMYSTKCFVHVREYSFLHFLHFLLLFFAS